MKNNRPIEVGQVRCIRCSNPSEDLLYVIKSFNEEHVWIQEIGKGNTDAVYRWNISDCNYDTVVM